MSLRDDHVSNKRMIESTAGESDYHNAVNNNVWLMDGGWCAWKSVLEEVCFRLSALRQGLMLNESFGYYVLSY